MGSICHVYKKNYWEIISKGKFVFDQEIAYEVKVGEWDDYGCSGNLKVWMHKKVYDKIMNDEYIVISQAYSDSPILVKDKNDNKINLFG